MTAVLDAERVRALNDILRRTLRGGTLMLTAGIVAFDPERQQTIIDATAAFDCFKSDKDPQGEHDLGALEAAGEGAFWKINYFDLAGRFAPPDPADRSVTYRVHTVMLAGEH